MYLPLLLILAYLRVDSIHAFALKNSFLSSTNHGAGRLAALNRTPCRRDQQRPPTASMSGSSGGNIGEFVYSSLSHFTLACIDGSTYLYRAIYTYCFRTETVFVLLLRYSSGDTWTAKFRASMICGLLRVTYGSSSRITGKFGGVCSKYSSVVYLFPLSADTLVIGQSA